MAQKYFVDSLIYRDYYENRRDSLRPLGEWALDFFRKVAEEAGIILYCKLVIEELGLAYDDALIVKIFSLVADFAVLVDVEPTSEQVLEANKLKKERDVPFADALYAVLARDNQSIVVTRDKHFAILLDIAESRKPEELI